MFSFKKKDRIADPSQELKREFPISQIPKKRKKIYEYLPQMNYRDAYLPPSHYFVKNGPYGKVYKVNKPKNNHIVKNKDPTLGGTSFNPPTMSSLF